MIEARRTTKWPPTPTVQNVELTAPYMHNGVHRTLDEVVDFYNRGGGAGLGLIVDNQTLPADSLGLTSMERRALVAFMRSLTDNAFTTARPRKTAGHRVRDHAVAAR